MTTVTAGSLEEVVREARAALGRKFEAGDVAAKTTFNPTGTELRAAALAWVLKQEVVGDFLGSVQARAAKGKFVSDAQIKGVLNWMSAQKKTGDSGKNSDLGLTEGRFAVEFGGKLRFYRVDQPDKGKWAGWTFVNELVGSQGDFARLKVTKADQKAVAALIAEDPLGAMQTFGSKVGQCALCGSPLTDETSRTRGIGPDCWKNKVVGK